MGKKGPPKGTPKTPGSGRKVGSTNKRGRAVAACEKAGIDPFDFLASIVRDTNERVDLRIQCAKELCEYVEPKLSRQESIHETEGQERGYLLLPVRAKEGRDT